MRRPGYSFYRIEFNLIIDYCWVQTTSSGVKTWYFVQNILFIWKLKRITKGLVYSTAMMFTNYFRMTNAYFALQITAKSRAKFGFEIRPQEVKWAQMIVSFCAFSHHTRVNSPIFFSSNVTQLGGQSANGFCVKHALCCIYFPSKIQILNRKK